MRIILVRHGHTTWNGENRYQGHKNSDLSELGRLQAASVADRLADEKIDAIYSSDLQRAVDTAEAIAGYHGLPVHTDCRLREAAFGEWEGLTVSEIKERYPDLYERYRADSISNRAPGGETLDQLQTRVVSAVEEIVSMHPVGTVVAVVHGGPIRAFFCHAMHTDFRSFRKMSLHNCGITVFACESDGRWVLTLLNDTCHLRSEALAGRVLVDGKVQVESR